MRNTWSKHCGGVLLLLAVLSGCGGGGGSGSGSDNIAIVSIGLGSAAARTQSWTRAALPPGITAVRLTVSAQDMAAVRADLPLDGSVVELRIPAGANRSFAADAYEGANITHTGATTVSQLIAGSRTRVTIALDPVATDTTPPTVIAVSPAGGTQNVAVNSVVLATFSEAIDPTTVNASTFRLNGGAVAGSVSYDAPSRTARFTPTSPLATNQVYDVEITTSVRDLAGNALAANFIWSFRTAPTAPAQAFTDAAATGTELGAVAVASDGSVWAWEFLREQQTPSRVQNLTNVGLVNIVAVAAGERHFLALRADGTVWAWGENSRGQLGDGTGINRSSPVQVTNLTSITAIAAGGEHSLALDSDGYVWAWGRNGEGQLGDGTGVSRNAPVLVPLPTNRRAITIAAGFHHSLASLVSRELVSPVGIPPVVAAWGSNDSGQFGNGTYESSNVPVLAVGGTATVLAAGFSTSFAIFIASGTETPYAWGANRVRQLGSTDSNASNNTPVAVQLPGRPQALAAGSNHGLALVLPDGAPAGSSLDLYEWGYYMGLPHNPTIISPPSRFTLLPLPARTIAAGVNHNVAILEDGSLWEWGQYIPPI